MTTPSIPVQPERRSELNEIVAVLRERFGSEVLVDPATDGYALTVRPVIPESLPQVCKFLFWDRKCILGGITAEEDPENWTLRYAFLLPESGWI